MLKKEEIAIIGCGAWGVALACMLGEHGYRVRIWSENPNKVSEINESRVLSALPGAVLPDSVTVGFSLREVLSDSELVIVAVASCFMRQTMQNIAPLLSSGQIIATATKGIEADTFMTMSQIAKDELSSVGLAECIPLVALSGPTHAEEVSIGMPSAIVAASRDEGASRFVQGLLSNEVFRVYTSGDIYGVELCGAVKNVIALAAGVAAGLGYGDNARAALVTRGLREISRLGMALGCDSATFSGLAGIGDLVVTAMSGHSRNYQAGYLLAQGFDFDQVQEKIGQAVEGLVTLPALISLAAKKGVDMPISNAVSNLVNGVISPSAMATGLMCRPLKSETASAPVKRVITYGTFDLLHYGHINLLRRAKALGDYLIVALSSDEFNWNEKQKKCYFSYKERKAILDAIEYVDLVIPEKSWDQKRSDIHDYAIDTFVMGDDWKGQFDFLEEEGAEIVYLPRTPDISTTRIKSDLAIS